MNKTRALSTLLVGVALTLTAHTAADAIGSHSTHTATAPSTTIMTTYGMVGPYIVTDDITKPQSDSDGAICWTEYNPYLEQDGTPWWNQEGICGDPTKAHSEYFLHWGIGAIATLQSTNDY